MRKTFRRCIVVLLVLVTAGLSTQAQNVGNESAGVRSELAVTHLTAPSRDSATGSPATQSAINSLSSLPEADGLIYINTQRILNEVLPKFLPAKDLEEIRKGFEQAKQSAGMDPSKVDYVICAIRFRKPTGELNFQAPEFMVVSSGDFSADSLMALAHMASQGKLRDETYGGKSMGLITIDPLVKEADKTPLLKSFTELGIVNLNANTIATGSPGYLRAAIDAANGKDRISAAALNSLLRDPNVLMSFAASPLRSFAKSFGMLGTETTARAPRCDSNFGDFYAALTMDTTNFMFRGVSNADNPDTARIIANLEIALLQYAMTAIPDKSAQAVLKGFRIAAEGDEVLVQADFPQQMVMDMIQQQMKPKPKEATDAKPITKPAVRRSRTRRRH